MAGRQQTVEDQLQGLPVLVCLAVRKNDRRDGETLEVPSQAFEIQRRDRLVGDDGNLFAPDVAREEIAIDQLLANENGIATLAEIDLKSLHWGPLDKGG